MFIWCICWMFTSDFGLLQILFGQIRLSLMVAPMERLKPTNLDPLNTFWGFFYTLYIEVIKYVNESWNCVLEIRIDARFVVPVSNETMKTVPIAQSFKGNSPRRNQTQKCWRRILWFSRTERRREKECQERVINKNAHHKGEHRSNINIFLLLAGQ